MITSIKHNLSRDKTLKLDKIKRILERAQNTPKWLGRKNLNILQRKYKFLPKYGYDPKSLEERGSKRARVIDKLIRNQKSHDIEFNRILELGCLDGMTSCCLKRMGYETTAIDINTNKFDERAIKKGVRLMQMDAAHLQSRDSSYDFVFSYNSFEHFDDPSLVLKEAVRVVRIGGYIYLDFGPLYMSPYGLHAYRLISVPYSQFLFTKNTMQEYLDDNDLGKIDFDQVNRWLLEQYRALWSKYSDRLEIINYYEMPNLLHVKLIKEYPSCFKSKIKDFDSLTIEVIRVLFKKVSM